jgi:hypothetical protein
MMQIITIITYNSYKQLNNIYSLTLKVPNVHSLSSFFMGQPLDRNSESYDVQERTVWGNKITISNTQLIHSITCSGVTVYKYTMIIHHDHDHDHDHTLTWKFYGYPFPYERDMWPPFKTFSFDCSDFYDVWETASFVQGSLRVITWSRDHVITWSRDHVFIRNIVLRCLLRKRQLEHDMTSRTCTSRTCSDRIQL